MINVTNIERIKSAMDAREARGAFLPAVYVLELTGECNLTCIMCPHGRMDVARKEHMSLELLERVLDRIADSAELIMLYFMGESTLHPEFEAALAMVRDRTRARIVISSNMAGVEERHIDAMLKYVDLVVCPMDRWDPLAYQSIRRGAEWSEVAANIDNLLARRQGPRPTVVAKMLGLNVSERNGGSVSNDEAHAFRSHWSSRGAIPLLGWVSTWGGQMLPLVKLSSISSPYANQSRTPCADLWFKMVVLNDGSVALCCNDYSGSVILGHLELDSVRDIWQSDMMAELREAHVEGQFNCNSLCEGCREWAEPSELDDYLTLNDEALYRVF